MLNKTALGKYGEQLSIYILQQWDFQILEKNWRFGSYEIDLIACKENILHVVEVKLRSGTVFGYPEENVNTKKLDNLKDAAEAYLNVNSNWKFISFDIMAILITNNGYEYRFFEDV